MLGTLFVTGVGALAFKLGMDAKQMKQEGKSTAEIAANLPGDAIGTVVTAAKKSYDTVRKWINKGASDEVIE